MCRTSASLIQAGTLGLMLFLAASSDAQEPARSDTKPAAGSKGGAATGNLNVLGDPKAAAAAAALLESAYEGERPPEGVRMLAAILRGSKMGPGEGWFGPADTRYSWQWLVNTCGVDPAQGGIPRNRFRGPDDWFARLDRNRDGVITADDLDWSERNSYVQLSNLTNRLFRMLNTTGDGKLTKEELLQFFDKAAEGKDHISADAFRDALLTGMFSARQPNNAPKQATLIRGLFAGDLGSLHEGPKLNDPAPDFTLKTVDGQGTVQLKKLLGSKPVVLIFGSFT